MTLALANALDDATLAARLQGGDKDAFAQLYDRHSVLAFRIARSICRDTGSAEDAVQEGFLAIWRSRTKYRSETGTFKSWAMMIVHNRAIDSYRRAARPQNQVAELGDEEQDTRSPSPSDQVIARSQADALQALLCQLPDEQAEVIRLAYYGELSQTEISTRLGIPQGTVKGRMRLGLEKLRARMDLIEPNVGAFSRRMTGAA